MHDTPSTLTPREHRIHAIFRVSVFLKGIHAILELIGGVLLFIFPISTYLPRFIASLTQEELSEDPHDLVANFLVNTAHNLSVSGDLFASVYLLLHGIVKLVLVVALLKGKLWAYPWSLGILGVFVVYQLYRFTHTHSLFLIALTIFDIFVMYFIWQEYKLVKKHLSASPH